MLTELSRKIYFNAIGQDSEFFLWDTQADALVPSYKYFPPKEEKVHVSSGSVYRDGLAVEANTDPQTCRAYVMDNVRQTLASARRLVTLPEHIKFTSRPLVEFTKELVEEFPLDLQVLGCSPTLDAYTEKRKVIKVNPRKLLFRTSGSHLHMGFRPKMVIPPTPQHKEIPQELFVPWVKAADLFVGVPFAYLFNDSDEFKRRSLYGQAGEFRYQRYSTETEGEDPAPYNVARGLEYRVLSSRLWDHPMITSLFLLFFKYIVGDANFVWTTLPQKWEKGWDDTIREAINLGTPSAQNEAMKLFALNFPSSGKDLFSTEYSTLGVDATFHLFNKLRELRKGFGDAGFINLPQPESHYGFNDYAANDFTFNPEHDPDDF